MKNIVFLFFVACQMVVYGQKDTIKIKNPQGLNYSKTNYPKNDELTYNQFIGETIAGFKLANGWRTDSINGGFNKEIYDNPFIKCEGDYIGFDKNKFLKVYRFKNGKRFTGKIADTLNLCYSYPNRVGIYYYRETTYERRDIQVILQTNCVNGLVDGVGTLCVLTSKKEISQCFFKKGELEGEVKNIGILTDNIEKKTYKKGSLREINQIETDKSGNKSEPDKTLSFKEAYETLLSPYEIVKINKKAKQTFIENSKKSSTLFRNPLLIEPLDIILSYFTSIKKQTLVKKDSTNGVSIREFKYEGNKIIFYSLTATNVNRNSEITECYDKNDRLIMVRYNNVNFEVIKNLDYPDYLKFYEKVGYGFNLTAYSYNKNGTLLKATKYAGVNDNDIDTMCDYSDFTAEILSLTTSKPLSIMTKVL